MMIAIIQIANWGFGRKKKGNASAFCARAFFRILMLSGCLSDTTRFAQSQYFSIHIYMFGDDAKSNLQYYKGIWWNLNATESPLVLFRVERFTSCQKCKLLTADRSPQAALSSKWSSSSSSLLMTRFRVLLVLLEWPLVRIRRPKDCQCHFQSSRQ